MKIKLNCLFTSTQNRNRTFLFSMTKSLIYDTTALVTFKSEDPSGQRLPEVV